jgi:hypothetical protein
MRLHEAPQFAKPPKSWFHFRFSAIHILKSLCYSTCTVTSERRIGTAQNLFQHNPLQCLNPAVLTNTPIRATVLLHKLIGPQPVKKFSFCWIRRFIAMFTRTQPPFRHYLKPDKSSPSPLIPFIRPILVLSAYLHTIVYNIQNKYMHLVRKLWVLFATQC